MKFPGKRKSKHYFPVNARDPLLQQFQPENETSAAWVVGIDQTLVDIEAKVDDEFIERYGLSAGHSLVIEDDVAEALYQELKQKNLITHQFAGGTIGNTMHNYSVLADDRSVLLGVMCSNIEIGSYAYRYLCNTSSRTDLNYLQGVDGPIGRCFTLIGESGERTFAISPGHMNQLRAESIPEDVIAGASALVLTSYLVRCKPGEPMPEATMKAIEYAKKYNVPVVLTLGTKFVIAENPQWWQQFLKDHVSILAMNEDEAEALTGESDPLLASDKALDWVDLVLCTAGPIGLYMAGFTEDEAKRKTQHPLLPGAIAEFNQYEFSRAMRHKDCQNPLRVYSHIAPYMGGPEKIMNTNGAGDVEMARALPAGSLAMIVGGHSQDPVCMAAENKKQVDYVPGTPCKPDQQNGIWIVQAHEWGKYVGRADFEFRNGEMKMVNYQLIPVNLKKKVTWEDGKSERVLYTPEIAENQQMISLLSPFQNKGKAQLEVKIGETNGRLEGDRDKVRFVQTNMGRLILAAQMDRTGADFAVMSGGGIRDSIEAGDISYKNVLKVQPFGNVVVYADMTGKEVIDYLTAVAQMKPDSGAYPQFANVSFVAKDGKLNDLKIKGEPVDPAKTYRMATLNFNATGGDGYPRLDNKPGYVSTGFIDAEVLKAYIQKSSPLDVSVYEPKGEVSWQ
ncbi:hypothetical protein XX94_000849 [Escherichia coli]|nr:hypothetical protein [Escherichia coli]EFL7390611.1 hypothetical protein [Escherichia coli]